MSTLKVRVTTTIMVAILGVIVLFTSSGCKEWVQGPHYSPKYELVQIGNKTHTESGWSASFFLFMGKAGSYSSEEQRVRFLAKSTNGGATYFTLPMRYVEFIIDEQYKTPFVSIVHTHEFAHNRIPNTLRQHMNLFDGFSGNTECDHFYSHHIVRIYCSAAVVPTRLNEIDIME